MTIAHEEIFGPILPVFTYLTIEEAIAFVDARPRPWRSTISGTTRQHSARCSTARHPAMARSCTSRRTTCRLAGSALVRLACSTASKDFAG
ncbi:aldehyde dehydrogenase family protein [Massilia antarctica]|uniref:aldehyde dehydrogenase family protein n=1 Tax=Massilia antarctica TaxID=2765360 RepID=UPI001E635BF9|nr:aldehyde dehydrogenase family protein [Massilia sp. H27-R4]MCY0914819.1 aldehyde dehydrogenase family protein [Massilia sp. H27-R4]